MSLVPIVAHIKCVMLYLVTAVHWHESDTATDRIRCLPWPTKQGPTVMLHIFISSMPPFLFNLNTIAAVVHIRCIYSI